ncbi:MAG TPA: H-NS histone family protein [Xanthomonadaceae bacterium]|nr:H-NS histone family protein [Xanthomonadaceae bacterium]
MSIDLSKLDTKELDELIAQAKSQKSRIKRSRIADVRKKLRKMAKDEGYSIDELFGGKPSAKGSAEAKYRNPDNARETWSGRGRKPRWFEAALKAGKSEASMRVK